MKISDELKAYLEGVEGTVEATSFEKHCLWTMYSKESDRAGFGLKASTRLYDWKDTGMGYLPSAGEFGGSRVGISVLTAQIDGMKVLFWYGSGSVLNYEVIDQWLNEHVPNYAANHTDAQNFHNIFADHKRAIAA